MTGGQLHCVWILHPALTLVTYHWLEPTEEDPGLDFSFCEHLSSALPWWNEYFHSQATKPCYQILIIQWSNINRMKLSISKWNERALWGTFLKIPNCLEAGCRSWTDTAFMWKWQIHGGTAYLVCNVSIYELLWRGDERGGNHTRSLGGAIWNSLSGV